MGKRVRYDQYGRKANWFKDYDKAYLDKLVIDLKKIELVFRLEFRMQIYLVYGTLLGAVRSNDFIPHDFDIDIAYLSRKRSERGIFAEQERIAAKFRKLGRLVEARNHGQFLLYSEYHPTRNAYPHGIEVWTSWNSKGRYHLYPDIPGGLAAADVLPLKTRSLRGQAFRVPKRQDAVLEATYGKGWSVPIEPRDYAPPNKRHHCFEFLRTDEPDQQ